MKRKRYNVRNRSQFEDVEWVHKKYVLRTMVIHYVLCLSMRKQDYIIMNNIKVYIYDSTDKVITMDSDTGYGGTFQRICMITS